MDLFSYPGFTRISTNLHTQTMHIPLVWTHTPKHEHTCLHSDVSRILVHTEPTVQAPLIHARHTPLLRSSCLGSVSFRLLGDSCYAKTHQQGGCDGTCALCFPNVRHRPPTCEKGRASLTQSPGRRFWDFTAPSVHQSDTSISQTHPSAHFLGCVA